MEKYFDLEYNITKQTNLLKAIKQLAEPDCRFSKQKRFDLRHCLVKYKRLTVVIEKQSRLRVFRY